MIKAGDGKIGVKEVTVIIIITMSLKVTDLTAVMLLQAGETAAWSLPIIGGMVAIIPLLCIFYLISQYNGLGYIQIVYRLTGRYIGFLLAALMTSFFIIATALNTRNYMDAISTIYFPDTPIVYIFMLTYGTCYFIAKRGLEGIGRLFWFLFPYTQVILVFLLLLLYDVLTWQYIFPIGGAGIPVLLKEGAFYGVIYADIIGLAIISHFVKGENSFKKGSLLGLLVSSLTISIVCLVYLMVFDVHATQNMNYPFHQLARKANLGTFIANVEAFFFFFWIVATTLRFSLYLYLSGASLGYTLKLNEYEPLILPVAGLSMMLAMIPEDSAEAMLSYREGLLFRFSWYYFFFVPIILALTHWWKGEQRC